ncbi:MAG: cupin domain-containing protein [Lachnospira sp.]
MKPYISIEEAVAKKDPSRLAMRLLTEENGCLNGCCSGITECRDTEYGPKMGVHDDQEGFFVLEGEGFVKLGDEEYSIKPGDSFIALPGVKHGLRVKDGVPCLKVFWFHSGV